MIYVRGLENEFINIKIIYNLFSNFGNIMKIIFLKKKSVALIDYESILNASHSKDNLNNINFFENTIKVMDFLLEILKFIRYFSQITLKLTLKTRMGLLKRSL